MCRVLEIKRSGYYNYQQTQANRMRNLLHNEILVCARKIMIESNCTYGSRRIKKVMNIMGYTISRSKAGKLLKEDGLVVRCKKKFKVTTNSNHKLPLFDNLLKRAFKVDCQDVIYVSDITYIWTQEGWLYLAVVIDLYSRKVVGWSMGARMTAKLVCDALKMAIWQRKPKPGLIHHSDRGSQYASNAFRKLLKLHGIKGSMSRKGDCWDNAVAESFFGTLKQERVHWCHYQTRYSAQQDVLQYISIFYNNKRIHSYLNYMNPKQFEEEMQKVEKVA
jgi:putative transposase